MIHRKAISLSIFLLLAPAFPLFADSVPPGAAKAVHNPAWLTSKKDAFEKAKKEKKLVIVDAFANWCGWCKRLDADVFDTPRFVDAAKKQFVLVRLNTEDGKEGTTYAQRFQIANLPTTLILDFDETVVGRIGGYIKYEEFMKYVDGFLKSYATLKLQDAEARGTRGSDAAFVMQISEAWQGRGESKKSMELSGLVADLKTATPEQRARAAFNTAANALKINRLDEAEKRLRQLEKITPFPADLDGMPEILRSDIAAMRGDFDTAIKVLEELMAKGNPAGEWRATLPNRISQLRQNKMFQDMQRQAPGTSHL